jgi:membrane protease YdiL (CAAX protease family)
MVSGPVAVVENEEHVPNSQATVDECASRGQITWTKALAVVSGRSVLAIAAQALVAAIFLWKGISHPWQASAPWWSVYAPLVDFGCLFLMARFTRSEGIRLRDLIGKIRWRDPLVGMGWFLLIFPFFWVASPLSSWLVWHTKQPYLYPGLLTARALPLWAVIYSLTVWWMMWSATEETTYQAYALPRLQALSGRAWVAILIVSFWWTVQHSFLPLILEWQYVFWRFLAFFPGVLVMTLIYHRTRRLPPLIFAHYLMDFSAMLMTLKL